MIKVDESDPVGEVEPSFPYRDVQMRRNLDMKELYEIQEEVGRGKFGIVYRCREKSTGLKLAAKLVSTPRREDRRNVEREVDIMRVLQHPRLIQLYDAFDNGKTMCVVLEMIEGGELFERVIDDDFILTEKACTVFMRQICEAMEFIHCKHILHLDMKPENILCLTKTGNRVKIIDFGLARKFDPDKKLQVLFGTPEFVAPEIVNFDQIGFGTDMWSIGVICYVLLSGLSPFMGETDVETMSNVTISKYDYEDEAFSDISDEAKDFIDKLLVKDKDRRMSATQCLAHPWLKRKPVQPPPADELDMSKENLRIFVERWNEHPNSPYLFDQSCQSILPCMPAKLANVKSETSLRGLSPSPCGSISSSSSESSSTRSESDTEVVKPSFVGSPAPFVASTPPKYHLERLQTFERRASDSSCVVVRAGNDSETRVNLADEIRKLSDKLFEMASLLNTPSVTPDVANNNLPGSSFAVGNSRPVPFPPPAPSDDAQPSWRRTKFRVSNMNRDVPLPPKPPTESGHQKPTNVGSFPPRPQPETFSTASQDSCGGGDITKDLLLQLLNKWDDQQQGTNNRRASFSGGRKSVSMEWSEEESLGQRTMNSLATYFQSSRTVDKKSLRLTASQAVEHKWLQGSAGETALSKTKLKRYVIKKRWIKAVNTIIALRRMGARLDADIF